MLGKKSIKQYEDIRNLLGYHPHGKSYDIQSIC